jgi:hypothetical protein
LHRHQFFRPGEFVLADKGESENRHAHIVIYLLAIGYPMSPYILRPYANDEMGTHRQRKRTFNRIISGTRVLVECSFGRFKARFPALLAMGTPADIKDLYRTLEALMALHNLCIDYHDTIDGLPDEYTQRLLDVRGGEEDDDYLREQFGHEEAWDDGDATEQEELLVAGRVFQEECLDILVPL